MDSGAATGKRHSAPCSNLDYDFFYAGLEEQKLLLQRCADCDALRNPPLPMCPACNSIQWSPAEMTGSGTVHSYTIHHYPPMPGFAMPHPVGVIDLDEGIRFLGGLDGVPVETVRIGLKVRAEFIRRNDVASIRFRAA